MGLMDFVLSFHSLPHSHALAATSAAFFILSRASCQIILPPPPPAPRRTSSVALWSLWRPWAPEGMGAAGEPWPWVPAQGGEFCWSQTRVWDAHELQTHQLHSIGAPSLQITKQFAAHLKSRYSAEGTGFFFPLSPLVLGIFFKMSQIDSL